MRWVCMGVMLVLAVAGCGDDDGADCGLRTTGLSGEGPSCGNSLECGEDRWELDCDGDGTGQCVCTKNGQTEKTVPYDDAFCPADFSTADSDAHQAAASDACGWP